MNCTRRRALGLLFVCFRIVVSIPAGWFQVSAKQLNDRDVSVPLYKGRSDIHGRPASLMRREAHDSQMNASVLLGDCEPPEGFACTDNGGEASSRFLAIPGNFLDASVHNAEAVQFVGLVHKLLEEHHIKVMYDLCVSSYGLMHLFPLFHVLPGEFVTTCSTRTHDPSKVFPKSVAGRVRFMGADGFTNMLNHDPGMIAVTTTGWEGVDGVSRPLRMVTLPHGDDEDGLMGEVERDKIKARPFQDLAYSRYARENRYESPSAVLSFLRNGMAKAHNNSACLKTSCLGVLLILMGSDNLILSSLDELAQRWKIVLRPHPLWWRGETKYQSLKPDVYFNDPSEGISLLDVLDTVDVVMTDSNGGLVAALQNNIHIPIVRFGVSAAQLDRLHDSVFNASMGVLVSDGADPTVGAVDAAVKQMCRGCNTVDAVLRARRDYLRRYLWTIDGFEEYRVAYQILADSLQSSTDLEPLRTSLEAITKVPPRPSELLNASYCGMSCSLGKDQQDAESENLERMKNPLRSFNLK